MHVNISVRRLTTAGVAAAVLALGTAAPAFAHVTVFSPDAEPGGYAKLTFRVPTESETASTTKLEVRFPESAPFASVSTKPHPGWTVRTKTEKLDKPVEVGGFTLNEAVTKITWTAQPGQGIKPGTFDEFAVSAGRLPATPTGPLTFPATQTYSNGEVVRWNDLPKSSGAEVEHPAPSLALTAEAKPASSTRRQVAAAQPTPTSNDMTARVLGGLALVFAGAAVASAVAGQRLRRD